MSPMYFRAVLIELPDGSMVDPATIEMIEPTERFESKPSPHSVKGVKVTFRSGRFRILEGVKLEEVAEMLRGQSISSPEEEPDGG